MADGKLKKKSGSANDVDLENANSLISGESGDEPLGDGGNDSLIVGFPMNIVGDGSGSFSDNIGLLNSPGSAKLTNSSSSDGASNLSSKNVEDSSFNNKKDINNIHNPFGDYPSTPFWMNIKTKKKVKGGEGYGQILDNDL